MSSSRRGVKGAGDDSSFLFTSLPTVNKSLWKPEEEEEEDTCVTPSGGLMVVCILLLLQCAEEEEDT